MTYPQKEGCIVKARHGIGLTAVLFALLPTAAGAQEQASTKKPNILVIFGDDVGQTNISAYTFGVVGYNTPNIDRIAKEGMMFTDSYAENSYTVRLYRPRAEILNGKWKFPEAQPVK
jgi:arylsulfatase